MATQIYQLVSSTDNQVDYSLLTSYDRKDYNETVSIYEHTRATIGYVPHRGFIEEELGYVKKFWKVKQHNVVQFHDFTTRYLLLALLLRLFTRCKVILFFHTDIGRMLSDHSKLRASVYKLIFTLSSSLWHRILCASKYMQTILLQEYHIGASKIIVIPNCINTDKFQAQTGKRTRRQGYPIVLFAGNVGPRKGADLLIRAFKKLNEIYPESHLDIVGSGEYLEPYKNMAKQLGLVKAVEFHGLVSGQRLMELYHTCDIFSLPSRFEPFGMVLLEAMAAGKPIVATNVGGIPEVVENGRNAIVIEPTEFQICEALILLSRSPQLTDAMSKRNLIDCKRFDCRQVGQKYIDLYNSL